MVLATRTKTKLSVKSSVLCSADDKKGVVLFCFHSVRQVLANRWVGQTTYRKAFSGVQAWPTKGKFGEDSETAEGEVQAKIR